MANNPDQETKEVENTEEEKTTVKDVYAQVDSMVQKFTMDFMNFLPKSPAVEVNIQIIADRLLTIKESAKLLINNFVIARDKDLEPESKEKTND